MSNNIEATIAALEAARSDSDRLWILKKASRYTGTVALGSFCRAVGATSQELGALLLARANDDK